VGPFTAQGKSTGPRWLACLTHPELKLLQCVLALRQGKDCGKTKFRKMNTRYVFTI